MYVKYFLWNGDKWVTMFENFGTPQWGHEWGSISGTTEGFIPWWNTYGWNCISYIKFDVILHTLQQCSLFSLAVNQTIFFAIVRFDWDFTAQVILLVLTEVGGVITFISLVMIEIGGVNNWNNNWNFFSVFIIFERPPFNKSFTSHPKIHHKIQAFFKNLL